MNDTDEVEDTWRCFCCKKLKEDVEDTPLGPCCQDCLEWATDMMEQ